jgi:hypothetical protein
MPKLPTSWNSNPNAQANLHVFDSGSILYDSSTVTFDGIVSGQSFSTVKNPTTWGASTKNATSWLANPAAFTTVDNYDTATGTYDGTGDPTALTYDALVAGQSVLGTKIATVWSTT